MEENMHVLKRVSTVLSLVLLSALLLLLLTGCDSEETKAAKEGFVTK